MVAEGVYQKQCLDDLPPHIKSMGPLKPSKCRICNKIAFGALCQKCLTEELRKAHYRTDCPYNFFRERWHWK